MQAQELLHGLLEDIEHLARSETIIGEPIELGELTIVPVISLRVGFGAGGGEGRGGVERQGTGEGVGGLGAGGIRVEPTAFIVKKGDDVQIMAAPAKHGAMSELFEKMPDMVDRIVEAAGQRAA